MSASLVTYYTVLQVEEDASGRDIRKAFLNLALSCHPDRRPDDESAIKAFRVIREAHDVLTVPHSRSAYDEKLRLIRERLGRAERHPPVVPYANCRFPAAGPHPAAAGNIIPTRRVMVPPHVRQMMACTTLPVLAPRYRYIAVIRTPRGRLIATLGLYGIVWSYLPEV